MRRYSFIARPPVRPVLESAPLAAVFAPANDTALAFVLAGLNNDGGEVWTAELGGSVARAVGYPGGVVTCPGRDRTGVLNQVSTPADEYVRHYADTGELLWRWRVPSSDRFEAPALDAVPDGAGGAYVAFKYGDVFHIDVYGVGRRVVALPEADTGGLLGSLPVPRALSLSHDGRVLFALTMDDSLSSTPVALAGIDAVTGTLLWVKPVYLTGHGEAWAMAALHNVPGAADLLVYMFPFYNGSSTTTRVQAIPLPDGPTVAPPAEGAALWTQERAARQPGDLLVMGDLVVLGEQLTNENDPIPTLRAYSTAGVFAWTAPVFSTGSGSSDRVERFGLAAWGGRVAAVHYRSNQPTWPRGVTAVDVTAGAATEVAGWTITPPAERPQIVQLTGMAEAAPL